MAAYTRKEGQQAIFCESMAHGYNDNVLVCLKLYSTSMQQLKIPFTAHIADWYHRILNYKNSKL